MQEEPRRRDRLYVAPRPTTWDVRPVRTVMPSPPHQVIERRSPVRMIDQVLPVHSTPQVASTVPTVTAVESPVLESAVQAESLSCYREDEPATAPAEITNHEKLKNRLAHRKRRRSKTAKSTISAEPSTDAKVAKKKSRRARTGRYAMATMAVILFALTSYVGYDTWMTNRQVESQVKGAMDAKNAATGAHTTASAEGRDETPISAYDINNYKVAADLPRFLMIDKLGIKARILPMSVNDDNSIQAPVNTNDAGWYNGSAKPGESGAAFIDGHASGATKLGLFGRLSELSKGDKISVERGDGTVLNYQVVRVEIVPLSKVDMTEALSPADGVDKGLNLMTCSGKYVPKDKTFDKRVIVYTKEI